MKKNLAESKQSELETCLETRTDPTPVVINPIFGRERADLVNEMVWRDNIIPNPEALVISVDLGLGRHGNLSKPKLLETIYGGGERDSGSNDSGMMGYDM
ncbi:hypothetical protein Q3G72_002244 [Acer saccharum]|nr:hypothetical protein Q3G72_002244 [Acer saccharum]